VTSRALILDLTLFAFALLAFFGIAAMNLHGSLEKVERRHLQRFQRPILQLLEKAHHARDDLALQQTLRALAQAPGVHSAAIADPSERILAHSDPAQLGRTLRRPKGAIETPLRSNGATWGTLLVRYSDGIYRQVESKQTMIWILGLATLFGWQLVRVFGWQRTLAERTRSLADMQALLEEERKHRELQRKRDADQRLLTSTWLLSALEDQPALLLLDQNQRLVAYSKAAASLLSENQLVSGIGRSWLEIPPLRGCGRALQSSLAQVGSVATDSSPENDAVFEFRTFSGAGLSPAGTWIYVKSQRPTAKERGSGIIPP
jgi:hypothetical protein